MRRATALFAAALLAAPCQGAPRFWSVSPYEVRLVVAIDGPELRRPSNAAALERSLRERLNRGVRPLWKVSLELADGAVGAAIEGESPSLPAETDDAPGNADKTIVVALREAPDAVGIVAREYDHALDRWGTAHRLEIARLADAPEAIVRAAVASFAPLASFEIDPDQPGRVRLAYRGAELIAGEFGALDADEVLLPYWRRIDREGNPLPDGVRRVPWTYLVAEEAAAENAEIPARVFSHARVPFGSRRRGRVEQLALHVGRSPDASTVLRLHDRTDTAVPLSGYEVFASPPGSKELTRLGRSDADGRLAVPPDPAGGVVRMAHIKCGSSVVASLPIAVGVEPLLDTPLLNERKRLEAETKVAALREELVDLVARRRILAARIRKRLESDDIDAAERLLTEVEALPGLAQFNQSLGKAEQLYRASDPAAQRRLDRLFAETRAVLGSALNARETRQLADEVIEARRAGG